MIVYMPSVVTDTHTLISAVLIESSIVTNLLIILFPPLWFGLFLIPLHLPLPSLSLSTPHCHTGDQI